ncbi:MAG: sigma-70 family RNA polymerase sigma factor [Deltaproteobacteria bacterium]|nr:sigma-70 family RNA polymerase sigma factor [Deltaproteobacteria bacterium]MBW1994199.1 sigma-70 family RNA polymerase sigma factor [Deltaproteobacteria bacterium]MBW2150786.1 sigma-70 family RNA polymerase sigma factor [Deltaproteobacteria bacterium]
MIDPDQWVDQHGDYLYRFALSQVRDAGTAEELVQETFVAALRSQNNFKGRSSFRTWLIAILKHKIIDFFRKKSREDPRDDTEKYDDSTDRFFDAKGAWKIRPARWNTNPMEAYEQHEFMEVFYRCLSQLPERIAQAFTLREINGLSTEEICKLLNITATNCWVILYRARMSLRRCLELQWLKSN